MSLVERYIAAHERRLDDLEDMVKEMYQRSYAPSTGGFDGGGAGVGSFFADPGAVVIASGASETLTVYEVLAGGPTSIGERSAYNPYPDDTIEDARIMLTRNRDGSYTVANQACPPEGA